MQVNARDEKDLDEEKIKKSLGTAMGSNYDAGQKIQVHYFGLGLRVMVTVRVSVRD